jgi:DNA polymerase-3 subunit alpha
MDGSIRIAELIAKVKSFGHTAVALTDHGSLFGAVEFYQKAVDYGIKPILGAELHCEPSARTAQYIKEHDQKFLPYAVFNLVVLAKSNAGYKNLVKVVSSGFLEHEKNPLIPIVHQASLSKYASELIAICSCHNSEFSYLVAQLRAILGKNHLDFTKPSDDEKCGKILGALTDHVTFLKAAYGEGNVYVELTYNGLPGQKTLLNDLADAAAHFELPLVAAANAHYLNAEDSGVHTTLLAIKHDIKLNELRNSRKNVQAHLFTDEEMLKNYKKWPSALENIGKIVEQCDVKFVFDKYFLPKFDLGTGETAAEGLIRLAREGLEERFVNLRKVYGPSFTKEKEAEYSVRLDYEMNVINNMDFPGYFLIVQDFINWAKKNDIPVGPGRGSGAGSLVAYALKITDLDPIPYNLIFERFLNPERVSMPDFDIDFCQVRRDEVIQYVTERYGANQVAQITTFGKMLAKGAIRDVGRALDMGYMKVDRIAKLIPNEIGIKLQDAIDREPRIKEEASKNPLIDDLLKMALKLEGLSRHTSVHAAGIVISDGPMQDYVPVYKSENGGLITQFEMKNAEKVGLIKFDFLGLKTLTVLDHALKLIKKTVAPDFDFSTIPLDDKRVYQLISSGNSIGVFQLESTGMQQLSQKLKPDKFEDLIAQVALFRPGPLNSGMVEDFVERKHGRRKVEYMLPELEPILKDTYGTIVYQEQVQKIASVLANYSLGEADLLRRAMGKKKPEEMAKQKSRFVAGSNQNKIHEETAIKIFDQMAEFAEYGFNKSHSAGYGLISYQTAYLKTYFPDQFMAAIMTCDLDNTDKIIRYVHECRRMKIKLLPPCVNRSKLEFDVSSKGTIDYGLAAVKGIGAGSLEGLLKAREAGGKFKNLIDLTKRVNLHQTGKKTLELLIEAGAMDCFNISRPLLFSKVGELVKFSENYHGAKTSGQSLLFDDMCEEETTQSAALANQKNYSEEFISAEDLDFRYAKYKANEWLIREKNLLGVFFSAHPLEVFAEDVAKFGQSNLRDIMQHVGKSGIKVVAILTDFFERPAKDGRRSLVVRLEDQYAQVAPMLFDNDIPPEMPPLNSPVVCSFKVVKGFEKGMAPRLRLESVVSLEACRRNHVKGVRIEVLSQKLKPLRSLHEVMQVSPGQAKVELALNFSTLKLFLGSDTTSVDLSNDFIQRIKSISNDNANMLKMSYLS